MRIADLASFFRKILGEPTSDFFIRIFEIFSYLRKTYCLNEGQLDDDDMKSIRRRVERDDPEDGIYHFSQPDSNGDNFILGTAFTKRQNLKFNIFQCL